MYSRLYIQNFSMLYMYVQFFVYIIAHTLHIACFMLNSSMLTEYLHTLYITAHLKLVSVLSLGSECVYSEVVVLVDIVSQLGHGAHHKHITIRSCIILHGVRVRTDALRYMYM